MKIGPPTGHLFTAGVFKVFITECQFGSQHLIECCIGMLNSVARVVVFSAGVSSFHSVTFLACMFLDTLFSCLGTEEVVVLKLVAHPVHAYRYPG